MRHRTADWRMLSRAVVGTLVLVALAAAPGRGAPGEPVRIGLLLSYTGPAPFQARGVEQGVELAVEQAGRSVAGRSIEVTREDSESSATVAVTKARRLIEERRVHVLVGPVWSYEALAIHDLVTKSNVVWVVPVAFTRLLTTPESASEKLFRVVETSDQGNVPLGRWVGRKTSHRNFVALGSDVVAGHDSVDAFEAGLRAARGRVLRKLFMRVGTVDFAPFLAARNFEGADAVYAWFAGNDAIRFVQQYQEFGLKARLPLYGYESLVDEPYLSSIGEAAVGVISLAHYPSSLDTAENQAFARAYQARFREHPHHYSEYGYTAGRMILAALEETRGAAEDAVQLAKAMRRVAGRVQTPVGALALDRYNQRILDMYVVRTERTSSGLSNVVIDRIGRVAQVDVWQWWRR